MAEALYRKYRPQVFEDVVGQEHIERTIKNAIERDKVSHAYLFTGPRGTGKTTTARLLAKALLCQKGPTPEPDGTCEDCELIASGEHPDVYELDAASRTGVENVREEIIGRVQFAPTRGRYKIYIIDEVHMLSTAAFNALLKTLEEPPGHVVFILATTDPQKVPETIHSRCQRFDFRRISNEAIAARLGAICVAEGVEYEEDALELIAHRAEGGLRNALTSLEQLIAFGEGSVSMEVAERMLGSLDSSDLAEIVRFVGTRDVAACFKWTADFVETGSDLAQFTRDFAEHVRNLYVLSLAGAEAALDVTAAARRELMQELPMFGPDRLARLLGVLGDLSAELKTSTNPRLSFEIALTRMVRPESDLTLEGLAARIEELEAKVREGVALASVSPAAQVALPVQGGAAGASGLDEAHSAVAAARGPQAQVGGERPSNVGGSAARGAAEAAAAASFGAGEGAGASAQAPAQEAAVRAAGSAGVPEHLAAQLGNPAALQRLWQSVLASLKKAKTAYGVLFLNTKALFDAASGTLIVDFPAENEFAFKAVQKPDIQDELGRCIVAACGVALPYTLQKGGAAGATGSAAGGTAAATAARAAQPASAGSAGCAAADRAGVSEGAAALQAGAQPVAYAQGGFAENPRQAAGAQAAAQSAAQAAAQAPGFGTSRASSRAAATPEPAVRQEAPSAAPEYDGPPLDAYDDYVPYGDDGYGSPADLPPWDEPAPRQLERAAAGGPPAAAGSTQAAADVPPWEACEKKAPVSASGASSGGLAGEASPAETAAGGPPSEAELSVADLDAALAFGFGAGVTFTEV